MPKRAKASTSKDSRVPGQFEDEGSMSTNIENLSLDVQRSTSPNIEPFEPVDTTNPFVRRSSEAIRNLPPIAEAEPVSFSTPIKPAEGPTSNFGYFNVGDETRANLDKAGISHWRTSALTSVTGPLKNLELRTECYSDTGINLIACRSLTTLDRLGNEAGKLIGRVMRATELGTAYTGRTIRTVSTEKSHLSRNEERTIFKEFLKMLDELLREVVRYDDDKRTGYSLERETFQKMQEELKKLRREAIDDICDGGGIVPTLPIWGKDGNSDAFWSENDFEILGACYRVEVEQFLSLLTKYHKFTNNRSLQEDSSTTIQKIDKKEEEIIPSKAEEKPSSKTEVMKERELFEKEQGYSPQDDPGSISQVIKPKNRIKGRSWGGHPTEHVSSRRMKEMFGDHAPSAKNNVSTQNNNASASRTSNSEVQNNKRRDESAKETESKERHGAKLPDSGPPDDDNDDDDPAKKPRRNKSGMPKDNNKISNTPAVQNLEPQFDNRLKLDIIPQWDGDADTLSRWVLKINRLADRSQTVRTQLGHLVPARLTGAAETWYYSQGLGTRMELEKDWPTLRDGIGAYYMNRTYMNKQKLRANKASYREQDNSRETPSEYFVRKVELLSMVYDYNDEEIITEIMNGAPSSWVGILTPHLYEDLDEFQLAVKFHEDTLMRTESGRTRTFNRDFSISRNPFNSYRQGRANLVGWTKETLNPPFPKDDSNVSAKTTPEDKGARPCRHCGSGKHWDPECKYAKKGEKRARANLVSTSEEYSRAQEEYDAMYFDEISDDEEVKDF